jgi:hypothetical protein
MDDVAYFGISAWAPRAARDDPSSNCQLAAYDLVAGKLLWRREVSRRDSGGLGVGGGVCETCTDAAREVCNWTSSFAWAALSAAVAASGIGRGRYLVG